MNSPSAARSRGDTKVIPCHSAPALRMPSAAVSARGHSSARTAQALPSPLTAHASIAASTACSLLRRMCATSSADRMPASCTASGSTRVTSRPAYSNSSSRLR